MTKYSRLEKFLRHRDFILCVAIFSVIWLAPNTYYVYYSMMGSYDPIWREIVSGGVALLVVSGILIYTLDGDIKVANYYMWFEISMSSYYYITTIGWNWGLIPAFSFVFMLPISLKHYTIKLNKDTGLIEDGVLEGDVDSTLYAESTYNVDRLKNELEVQKRHGELMEKIACENKEHAMQYARQVDVLIDSHIAKEKEYVDEINKLNDNAKEQDKTISWFQDEMTKAYDIINIQKEKIVIEKPETITNMSESDLLKMVENLKNPPASLPSDDMF